MPDVVRLVSYADIDDRVDAAKADVMSISVRHEALLRDGRRVPLLSDRGWTSSGPGNIWGLTSVEDIVRTARMVVGPDEANGDHTDEDMALAHWEHVARILAVHGVTAGPGELRVLPHDVELSERLRDRLTP